ncbi:MAG TPA: hypothetical protein VFM79_05820 [Pelobium sp.]|nr:hypothetical protein [Pelobium sp.]
MRLGYLTSVAIIPLMMFTANFDQGNSQKNKDQKEQKDHHNKVEKKGKDHDDHGNGKHGHEDNDHKKNQNYKDNKQKDKDWKDKDDKAFKGKKWKVTDRWDDGKWDDERFEVRMAKIKGHKKSGWVNERYYQGVNWWNGDRYDEVKKPKGNKKVSLCHKPNGSDYPVTINVSENALQAHLRHGDYQGECKDWDRSSYSDTYWNTRTDYYNQYVQTTETLSVGEQLLALAIEKLTGARTQLTTLRPTLSPTEINRREVAIINLQNDTYSMQQTLDRGNNSIATVNFVF